MRIPDDALKCVAFLCVEGRHGAHTRFAYQGTAFFISVRGEQDPRAEFIYLATARHCVERASRAGKDLFLRVNLVKGGSQIVKLSSEWIFGEKESSDAAILPLMAPSREVIDYKWISEGTFATEDKLKSHDIGPGDELFMVGLFTQRHGTKQNVPIVRTGVIASMPDEPIQDPDTGLDFDAYLAEIRSIGGLSGSPVFAYLSTTNRPLATPTLGKLAWHIVLIGLIRGHWKTNASTSDIDLGQEDVKTLNTGIALVTPIQEIREILMSDELVKRRRIGEAEFQKTMAPVLDSAATDELASQKATDDETFTKADFEAALKKVARKVEPKE